MTAKSQRRQVVEFCAASPRLVLAYHHAAQRSKYLTNLADFRDLRQAVGIHDLGKHSREFQRVVLSHADDDYRALIDARAETLVSGAFHLLFTGPTTHPDQVAQWMRSTNIRSEHRLHVVKVEDMAGPQMSQLLGRVCFALGRDESRGSCPALLD
jgi:hypothetical protein